MLDLSAFQSSTETIAFNGITEVVYSDYNEKRPLSRADYIEIIKDKLSAFSSYFVYGGNYYSLENAAHVFEVSTSSGFNCLSESVPFYQMVLSGKITYSYGALNTSASPTDEILRVLSTGAVPSFELRSESDKDGIEEILSEYMEDFRKVSGRKITSYLIISDAVRETVFDDGTTVRVDYQNGSYTVNGGEL